MSAALSAIDLSHPALVGRSGRNVSVAIIDSGINPRHEHVGEVGGGVAIGPDGELEEDYVDRIGHGTAVAAAVHEKAPDAALFAVRVFARSLATNARALARAIEWASSHGIRLINLSLGTTKTEHQRLLREAVEHAVPSGALIVSAAEHQGERWLPGSLPGVVSVQLDWDCPREELRLGLGANGEPTFRASGYPRPIPGVPPERNLKGISFSVANVTGVLARLFEGRPELRTPEEVFEALTSRPLPAGPRPSAR